MAKNRFEQVDEPQPDAITLSLGQRDGKSFIRIACPADLAGGHLANDFISDELEPVEGFRSAVRLANEIASARSVRASAASRWAAATPSCTWLISLRAWAASARAVADSARARSACSSAGCKPCSPSTRTGLWTGAFSTSSCR